MKRTTFLTLALLMLKVLPVAAQANNALSNLSATSVNADLIPASDNVVALGSAAKAWKQLYLNSAVFLGGSKFLSYGSAISARNTAVGYNALFNNASGTFNTALGAASLQFNTSGSGNVAIGYSALSANTGGYANLAIGIRALNANSNGHNLIAIGDSTLMRHVGGSGFNIAIGSKALYSNTTGDHNTAIGSSSFYKNTTGRNNAGLGSSALYNNTSGAENNAFGHAALLLNTTGGGNTAIGAFSMNNNTSGYSNIAIGSRALNNNSTSSHSVAIGDSALYYGNGGNNVAVGSKVMYSNTSGGYNLGSGFNALYSNTGGSFNVALGPEAMWLNATGSYNTAMGYQALYAGQAGYSSAVGAYALNTNTTGTFNSAQGFASLYLNSTGYYNAGFGAYSLYSNTTGLYNTALGYFADISNGTLSNASAIGYNAMATGSNQIRLGNTSITSILATVNITTSSDGRYKKNIKANVPGLEFINQLRPVTYNYNIKGMNEKMGVKDTHARAKMITSKGAAGNVEPENALRAEEEAIEAKEKILYTGFVAQEVEAAAQKLSYDFSGLYKPQNEKDIYGLSYAEFVVPLVKGMQQLSDSNTAKNAQIDSLKSHIDAMQTQIDELRHLVTGSLSGSASLTGASLAQNFPNPVAGFTNIGYVLPQKYGRAKMMVTDMAGKLIRTLPLNGAGRGNLNLQTSGLAAGVYNYTLYVDGAMIDSKQMITR